MLETDLNIHLECKVSCSRMSVNCVIDGQALKEELLNNYQLHLLDKYLGCKYSKKEYCSSALLCTYCKGQLFTRRGSRTRKVLSSSGVIMFRLYQITCLGCQRTFSPFSDLLSLRPRQRITDELEHKVIELVKDISYGQSAKKIGIIAQCKISAQGIHNIIKRRSKGLALNDGKPTRIIILDSTKVRASDKKFQDSLNVAIGIRRRYKRLNRFYNEKNILAFNCGKPWRSLYA